MYRQLIKRTVCTSGMRLSTRFISIGLGSNFTQLHWSNESHTLNLLKMSNNWDPRFNKVHLYYLVLRHLYIYIYKKLLTELVLKGHSNVNSDIDDLDL